MTRNIASLDNYSDYEAQLLLHIARRTLEIVTDVDDAGMGKTRAEAADLLADELDFPKLPASLRVERACFITLEMRDDGQLRGCTGTLEARLPLAEEVIYSTHHTAFFDPRFPAVEAQEVDHLRVEISVLTPPQALSYDGADALCRTLRPGVDGVTLRIKGYRGTFLPQVWERFPDPHDFLGALCHKMGLPKKAWRSGDAEVEIYSAIKLIESD
jgi:AmmeMemoRadiSam system protein A